MKLHIGTGFSLPLDFVTQTQAILAKKRVGKSYTASVQAEELLTAHQQIVVIDPTGAWWGLKSSADGKSAGFQIAVFGGEHADIPLEESAGETIASALVEQRFSAIIDLSLFRKGQINRFMAPFLEALYRLNREAMHLFVDEADAIAPQKPFGEEARMLGAMEDVVRRGGIRGIGTTLITQRPAVLNKNVLTQCEILCALRIVHHKDINAIREWVAVHGDEALAEKMMKSLPSLPIGTAWFWAPGWGDLFQQVKIRERTTFDSGATPKPGEAKRTAKVLATVDIQKLGQQIQATVERVKENDPKELKRKIAELTNQLKKQQPKSAEVDEATIKKAVDSVITQRDREHRQQLSGFQTIIERMQTSLAKIGKEAGQFVSVELPKEKHEAPTISLPVRRAFTPPPKPQKFSSPALAGDELTGPEQKIMKAMGELLSIGKEQPPKNMVAAWSGYSPIGGAFGNPIGKLRTKGLIDYPMPGTVSLTNEGRRTVGDCAPPDRDEVMRRIQRTCSGPEQKILAALIESGDTEISKNELAERSGYSPIGGAFGNPVGSLRTKGLLDYPRQGVVKAADWLLEFIA